MARRPVDQRASIDLFRTLYERASREPLAWRMASDSLRRAARTLLPVIENDEKVLCNQQSEDNIEPPLSPVYMLLVGLAIENLVKGICVANAPNIIENDRLGRGMRTHSILDLLARAHVTVSQEDSELIERLEVFVNWAGRYPIPAKLGDSLPRTNSTGGFGPLNYFSSRDPELLEYLMDRLEETLNSARKSTSAMKSGSG
jgi:hypothetical protein